MSKSDIEMSVAEETLDMAKHVTDLQQLIVDAYGSGLIGDVSKSLDAVSIYNCSVSRILRAAEYPRPTESTGDILLTIVWDLVHQIKEKQTALTHIIVGIISKQLHLKDWSTLEDFFEDLDDPMMVLETVKQCLLEQQAMAQEELHSEEADASTGMTL